MPHPPLETLLLPAIQAVRQAGLACRSVRAGFDPGQEVRKQDSSPVTVADFTSQALVCRALAQTPIPGGPIPVVAEEGTGALRMTENHHVRRQVVEHVSTALGEPTAEVQVMAWIDLGANDPKKLGADPTARVFWTLDPIDGTKGFIRGQQYAVCLALIVGAEPVLGVLGCPNLTLDSTKPGTGRGTLFFASKGHGAWCLPLDPEPGLASAARLHASNITDPGQALLAKSWESSHSDGSASARVMARLGSAREPLALDSQAKYGLVAAGEASLYMRLPKNAEYHEYIWDHAAGVIVVEEAGGRIVDVTGRRLDFSRGSTLLANRGVIGCAPGIFDPVMQAVRSVLG